ncbi:hypothetical protein BU16DRAFT_565581 [Lophium mytilinum]|uniref:BTB domain-containing protein n=1 Tax=Lophium mytilinum TaxID=390894 RepID=A0A6A6QIQ3_9PEZI|nr:hypothetical protein BU16DRAFT_565581 [Lophium mytilinum]
MAADWDNSQTGTSWKPYMAYTSRTNPEPSLPEPGIAGYATQALLEIRPGEEMVTIIVGTGQYDVAGGRIAQATFQTSKDYICKASSFFANAFRGSFREASQRILRLPDDEPSSFRLWHDFYDKNDRKKSWESCLNPPHKPRSFFWELHPNAKTRATLWELVKAWLFGEKYSLPEFQNFLMSILRRVTRSGSPSNGTPGYCIPLSIMKYVYENTLAGSPLRFFLVENMCRQLHDRVKRWEDFSEMENYTGFAKEMFVGRDNCNFEGKDQCVWKMRDHLFHVGANIERQANVNGMMIVSGAKDHPELCEENVWYSFTKNGGVDVVRDPNDSW